MFSFDRSQTRKKRKTKAKATATKMTTKTTAIRSERARLYFSGCKDGGASPAELNRLGHQWGGGLVATNLLLYSSNPSHDRVARSAIRLGFEGMKNNGKTDFMAIN